jgi:dTDP-4-dehydrorhamnose reductase
MKILITGGSGLLGQYLNMKLSNDHIILTQYKTHTGNCFNYDSVQTDITRRNEIREIFTSFKPDIVVHTAAVSDSRQTLQNNPGRVYDINVNATKNIALLCAENNARLVYTSTDLIYAGYRGGMLKEDAKHDPVSLYAETKLMGEVKIKEIFNNYLILRVALLYGYGMNKTYNHFNQMYLNLKDGIPVKLFTDQFRTPLELSNAASIISKLIVNNVKKETINLGGYQRVSRYQLGEMLCNIADFNKELLHPIIMDDVPDLPKVEDVSLDTSKLQSFGIKQRSIEESIEVFLSRI